MSEALLTDLYQLTMMQGFFKKGIHRQRCVFDRFYRTNPFKNGYTVVAGLEHVLHYLRHLKFEKEDIAYLKDTGLFEKEFLAYLEGFRFTGDVYAVSEGSVAFPGEVLLRIEAPKDEAILIETPLSMFMNHESLIATKARRMRNVAGADMMAEFGLRRAQGASAAIYGARAAMIGGFNSTSNVESARIFGIRPSGTMAHSWVMSFPTELEAFRSYAAAYENILILLVDTYNTLGQGVPNAIRVFEEVKAKRGGTMPEGYGIRLDSGDLTKLSKEARKMLDAAGFAEARIIASNDLDEYLIADLKRQGASIDGWGVGTKLITADGTSALGGVYKLAGQWDDEGIFHPKMKISENIEKETNPGRKQVLRFKDKETGQYLGDLMVLEEEATVDTTQDFHFINPFAPWHKMRLKGGTYEVLPLLEPVILNGEIVKERPSLEEIVAHADAEMKRLGPEFYRLANQPSYPVYISQKIFDLRKTITEIKENNNVI